MSKQNKQEQEVSMCRFFSFVTNGRGSIFYLDREQRKEAVENNENPDSHSYIVRYFQDKGKLAIGKPVEDKLNKYEFDPFTLQLKLDSKGTKDDKMDVLLWCKNNVDTILATTVSGEASEAAYLYCRDVEDRPEVRKHIVDSHWAYLYCRDVEDRPEVRKHIVDSHWAYRYCGDIEDRPEVRKNITDSKWAYEYCKNIKDCKEVRKNITDSEWAYEYCINIKDCTEVRKNIVDSHWACWYCKDVKDRPEVRKHITDSRWAYWYCKDVKDRPEVRKHVKK
jgi:hypothetical protein